VSETEGIVYLLDDEPGMVRALTRLLRVEGFAVMGFTSPAGFLKAVEARQGGCLVLDVAMPELDGMLLQKRLAHDGILLPIVFLTGHGDIPMSVRAIKAGAVDFLTKPVDAASLIRAVRAALARAAAQRKTAEAARRLARLTPRERQVLEHVIGGLPNKLIASELGTGEQNIKIHRARVMQKMQVQSLPDLVRLAEQIGIRSGGAARPGAACAGSGYTGV
jgi:FixJ family two-component response regulator